MTSIPKILITAPMRMRDATQYTYQWAMKAISMSKNLGYIVKVLDKEQVTRKNFEKVIEENNFRLILHLGHGCVRSLQGNNECFVNTDYTLEQIMSLAYSNCDCDRKKAYELLNDGLDMDPCRLSCDYPSNIQRLEGCIVVAIACNSSAVLGRDAIDNGVQSYAGNKDLLIFPVDRLRTQEAYGDMELEFVHELLLGHTFRDAKKAKLKMMDDFITKNKRIKYLALTALFNRLNFEILGDLNATIFT